MPNDDYIKRSDAIREFAGVPNDLYYTCGIVAALERIPAADVEPVIRCRDCKNSSMCDPGGIRCTKILNNGKYMPVEGDFFCAYGAKVEHGTVKEEDNAEVH